MAGQTSQMNVGNWVPSRGARLLFTAVAALVLTSGGAVLASEKPKAAAPKSAYKSPRNIFGQPDLEGSWTNASLTSETRPKGVSGLVYTPEEVKKLEDYAAYEVVVGNQNTDPNAGVNVSNGLELRESFARAGGDVGGYNRGWLDPGNHVMRVDGQPRTSFLTTQDGRVPPRKPGVVAVAEADYGGEGGPAGASDNPEDRTLGDRCLVFGRGVGPPMLPNGFYNNNYKIVQSRDEVAILVEMVHDVRHIALNRKEHLPSHIRPWYGDSIGRYEGDTLVVETTNIPKGLAYNGSWEHLKVTEHFRRVGPDRLFYRYTIEDPSMWERSFSGEYEFSPLTGQIYEYACHEGNYALEGILAGARQQEREAADRASGAGRR